MSDDEEPAEDADGFPERLLAFSKLGFDDLTAFALAWSDASPADCRERLLKRGATHEQAAKVLL